MKRRIAARVHGTELFMPVVAACMLAGIPALVLAAGGTVSGKVTATPPKYLEETVVYLQDVPGSVTPRSEVMDQKGMKFIPHILTIAKGDTVRFQNHDSVAHNVFSSDHDGYNLGTFAAGQVRTHVFKDDTGAYTQLCSIHPEMLGYIFVGKNRYSAAVDHQGKYTLADVPPGTYSVEIWNSHLKAAPQKVTVAAGKTVDANFTLHR